MSNQQPKRNYLSSALGCYCPRCREGKLYKNKLSFNLKKTMEMNKECPVCGQVSEIEVGFYYGTSYVSYAIGVAISVASLIAWWVFIGFSINDSRFFYWLGVNAVLLILLQPWLMRVSRSLWLSWFVGYNKNWRTDKPADFSERRNLDQENNW